MSPTHFAVYSRSGSARTGVLSTPRGDVSTPAFVPVGSLGSVRSVLPEEVHQLGGRILLCNTYHLTLQPGIEVIESLGKLHSFMGWQGPIVTDSGGFQVFSLPLHRVLNDEGVVFRSPSDGSKHVFTPENVIYRQEQLGVDLLMPLDECLPATAGLSEWRRALDRTNAWLRRGIAAHNGNHGLLFGIVQGGFDGALRRQAARFITSQDVEAYAIGGLSVGERKVVTYEMLDHVISLLSSDRPRHLLGMGSPEDLVEGVARGVDLFDCALPTRVARTGALFTLDGRINITAARFRLQSGPVEEGCECPACQKFSAAYLHHLFKANELLGYRLATLHNLRFVFRLMERMREAIRKGQFSALYDEFLGRYRPADESIRLGGRSGR